MPCSCSRLLIRGWKDTRGLASAEAVVCLRRRFGVGLGIVAVALTLLALLPSSGAGRTLDTDETLSLAPQDATKPLGAHTRLLRLSPNGNDDTVGHTVTITVTDGPDARPGDEWPSWPERRYGLADLHEPRTGRDGFDLGLGRRQ